MRAALRGGVYTVAIALVVAPRPALAAPAARLVYSRSSDAVACPDEAAMRAAVASRVGYDPFFPWAKRTVLASMSRVDAGFVATVELVDEDGIRHGSHELRTSGACSDLLDPVALAVTIAIDPRLLVSAPATFAPPPAAPPPPQAPAFPWLPPGPVAPPPPPPPKAPDPVVLEASLGATAGLGLTQEPSLGATVGVAARWRWLSLGLEGSFAGQLVSDTFTVWPVMATLVPCAHVGPFFGCALGQIGALHAQASGAGGGSSWTPTAAIGSRVGGQLPLSRRVALRLRLDVLGAVAPPNLTFGNTTWEPSAAGTVGIDAVVRFP